VAEDNIVRLAEMVRDTPDWYGDCILNDKGFPIANVENARVALRSDQAMQGVVAYDEMFCGAKLLKPVPDSKFRNETFPRPVTDDDVTEMQSWLQRMGLKIGKDIAHQAVDARARECSFHPVRDYLNALVWDETPRLADFFPSYFGADDTEYVRAIGPLFMKSLVARILKPGCKSDHMVILEGDQGTLKSTACEVLAKEWFSDHLPDIASKDASQHLKGKWLIEQSEMHAQGRAETSHFKAFITRKEERYRPSFGRKEVYEPRQCIFIGTTNKTDYLKDATGGRRFWPIRCGRINIDALERDRDQLFAEATHRVFILGEEWWPSKDFERLHIQPEQEARNEGDPWDELVGKYLVGLQETTIAATGKGIGLFPERMGRSEQLRIADILRRLQWHYGHRTKVAQFWIPKRAARG
jgi:predicted P-loop ATPase